VVRKEGNWTWLGKGSGRNGIFLLAGEGREISRPRF
jgi:hypothetical protein